MEYIRNTYILGKQRGIQLKNNDFYAMSFCLIVGTIFGVYGTTGLGAEQDVLQPGNKLLASGYILYSSATIFVVTIGSGTHGFTLDPSIGEFIMTHPDMRVPDRGQIYSLNDARSSY